MSYAYWVRLTDGSEIGPLDPAALQSWFENGLIGRDTPARRDGSPRWNRLAQEIDVRTWRGGAATPARPATPAPRALSARPTPRTPVALPSAQAEASPGRARALLAGAVALVVVLLAAGLLLRGRAGSTENGPLRFSDERRVEDPAAGLVLSLPAAWAALEGEPFPVPPDARQRLHARDARASAYLVSRQCPPGATLTEALELSLRAWRPLAPGFTEKQRREVRVAGRQGLAVEGRRDGPNGAEWARLTVWREGWHELALVVWAPEARERAAASATDQLVAAVLHPNGFGLQLEEALGRAAKEVPFLDRATAERLMQSSQAQILEPPDLLRRSYERLGRGLPVLSPGEQADLTRLHGALYAALAGRDRQRLADYVEKARDRQPLAEDDDRAVLPLLQRGCARLGTKQQERLRQLFGRAVASAQGA